MHFHLLSCFNPKNIIATNTSWEVTVSRDCISSKVRKKIIKKVLKCSVKLICIFHLAATHQVKLRENFLTLNFLKNMGKRIWTVLEIFQFQRIHLNMCRDIQIYEECFLPVPQTIPQSSSSFRSHSKT